MARRLGSFSVLILLLTTIALVATVFTSCGPRPGPAPSPTPPKIPDLTGTNPSSDWWKHRGDLTNTGNALETSALVPPLELIHQVLIGSDPDGDYRTGYPAFAHGKVYFPFNTQEDGLGRLVGVDIETGEIVFDVGIPAVEGAGDVHVSDTPVAASGALFMRVSYLEEREPGELQPYLFGRTYAFSEEDGSVIWNYDDDSHSGHEGRLTCSGGAIYLADSPLRVLALRMTDGSVIWSTPLSGEVGRGQSPALWGGSLIVCTSEGVTMLSDTNGDIQKRATFPEPYRGSLAPPIVNSDVEIGERPLVYFSGTPKGGEEEEEWGTGAVVRAYRTNLPPPTWEAVLDDGSRMSGSMMAYGGGRLFVVRHHTIWALDPYTGEIFWTHEREGGRAYGAPVLAANGSYLYVRTDHHVYGFSAETGEEVWSHELPDLLQHIGQPSGMAAARNRLVLASGAYLYIYGPPE